MLVLLVGPKGSGKTHIGRLLESELGVRFFHVEPLWMDYHAECRRDGRAISIPEGITRVHPAIDGALQSHGAVCVETTGASPEILDDLVRLGERHGLLLIRVEAPLDLCLERIAARDPEHQIPMDPEMIARVYELGSAVDLPFDLSLRNIALSDEEILQALRAALARTRPND